MSNMRQVTKEQFEMLTIFHPGEVRYYVDIGTVVNKNRGAKVNIRRKPKRTDPVASTSSPQAGEVKNKFVQVTTKGAGNMKPDSIQYNVYCAATRLLASDPTKVMRRKELVKKLVKALPNYNKISQITPSVTALIRLGNLRYSGEPTNA